MSVELKNNQFFSYLLILGALFILVLFTKHEVGTLQGNMDRKDGLERELQQAREKQEHLQNIALELEKQGSEIQRFTQDFTEDEILAYFYNYASKVKASEGSLEINSLSLGQSRKNELGFHELTVNVSVQVSSVEVMKKLLDYLVDETSQYQFYIENFYYPNDNREGNFNIQLPLKIFYR